MEDYEPLLDPNFSAVSFANDLLTITNSNPNELDLLTSIKKINFDLNNIDKQIDKSCSDNYSEIAKELQYNNEMLEKYQKILNLSELNDSFSALETNLLTPFNNSIENQDILKKINSISILLKSVLYYIYLYRNIQHQLSAKLTLNSVYKVSKLFNEINNLILVDNKSLKSLKIIRDLELSLKDKSFQVIDFLENQLLSNKDTTQEDINLLIECFDLIDTEKLIIFIKGYIFKLVNESNSILIKNLNSPKNFNSNLIEISNSLTKLNSFEEINNKQLINKVLKSLNLTSLQSFFWVNLSVSYKQKFNETIRRGGPVAKLLINYNDSFKNSIITVLKGCGFDKESNEVKEMLNSVQINK